MGRLAIAERANDTAAILAAGLDLCQAAQANPDKMKWVDDAPLPEVDGTLPAVPADPGRLAELGERWGLGSSLSRFASAVSPS